MTLAQYLTYFLYLLACIFLFLVVRNFIQRRLRKMIMFLVISMLSSGTGHMIQQKGSNSFSLYRRSYEPDWEIISFYVCKKKEKMDKNNMCAAERMQKILSMSKMTDLDAAAPIIFSEE